MNWKACQRAAIVAFLAIAAVVVGVLKDAMITLGHDWVVGVLVESATGLFDDRGSDQCAIDDVLHAPQVGLPER